MKAALLTWALPLLFVGATVARDAVNSAGRIVHTVDCLACPCMDCDFRMTYNKEDVSTVDLPVSDLY